MTNQKIRVSIFCVAYNHEKLIRSALEGFVMQKTNFPFEVLVHDDASTDGTALIIKEYARKYPDLIIPIFQTENQYSRGGGIIRRFLMPLARGEYFAFCEGDDFWTDPLKLQKQVDFLDTHPDYVACVHNSLVHDCSGITPDCLHVPYTEDHDVTFELVLRGMGHAYQTSSLVRRRDPDLKTPDFYDIAASYGFTDWPRAIWMTLYGKIRFLSGEMSTYRLKSNPDSWSYKDFSVKKKLYNIEGNIAMLEALKKHVSEERKALIEYEILKKNFEMLAYKEKFDEMTKPPYNVIWNQLSVMDRIKYRVKRYFPWLYHRLRKIRD